VKILPIWSPWPQATVTLENLLFPGNELFRSPYTNCLLGGKGQKSGTKIIDTFCRKNLIKDSSFIVAFYLDYCCYCCCHYCYYIFLQTFRQKKKRNTGLPDFPWCNIPKRRKIYQITTKYTKCYKI
jgi:hypothetical protein